MYWLLIGLYMVGSTMHAQVSNTYPTEQACEERAQNVMDLTQQNMILKCLHVDEVKTLSLGRGVWR